MGIEIATEKEYSTAIRQLFPRGEYWEKQFADPESDLNIFCKVKTNEVINLRKRLCDLLAESNSDTSIETIENWERVLLGHTNNLLAIEERRNNLKVQKTSSINRMVLADIAKNYGLNFIDLIFPFKSSFFGFSNFGISTFSCPAFFSVFYIIIEIQDEKMDNKEKILEDFEQAVTNRLLSGNIAYFQYKYIKE